LIPCSRLTRAQKIDVHQPGVLLRHLAVVEHDQRRDAGDAVAAGDGRLLVDIDLGEAGARPELLGRPDREPA